MSNKEESLNSNPSDEIKKQDLPANAEHGGGEDARPSDDASISPGQDSEEQADSSVEEGAEKESAAEDPFDDIRRSLVEEETLERGKREKGIFQRVKGLFKRKKVEKPDVDETEPGDAEAPLVTEEVAGTTSGGEDVPVVETAEMLQIEADGEDVVAVGEDQEVEPVIPDIEAIESILEKLEDEASFQPDLEMSDVEDTVRASRVLRVKPEDKDIDEKFEAIREVALEDYDSSKAEADAAPAIPWRQRARILLRGLKPLDKFLISIALLLLFIGGMVGVVGLGLRAINFQLPEITPVPTQDLPFPVRVTLPGGWDFNLAKGNVENDRWSPRDAEWLEGTEVCRWIALPWSLQLEAVVRTLKLDDPIELTMSNADQLPFKVKSIQRVPIDQIDRLESTSPCLLLILANEDSDTRWVVTAIP
jgi:hypothetical protein